MKPKKIVITGTHLTPSLALIDKLASKSYKITYFCRPRRIEKKLLRKKKITLFTLKAPKLHRHDLTSIINLPLKLPQATFTAFKKLRQLKPNLVISFGGYVALPVCLSAYLLKIPIIIHEQTFAVGLVNKLTSPLATKIAISWPESQKHFFKNKTILIGNPIRQELINLKSSKPGNLKAKTIYITGGNQGSRAINQAISKLLPKLLKQYHLVHQFGLSQSDSDWQAQLNIKNALPDNLSSKYILKQWFDVKELTNILSKSSLVISRSGANTITELAFLNKPALLIPLPVSQKKRTTS